MPQTPEQQGGAEQRGNHRQQGQRRVTQQAQIELLQAHAHRDETQQALIQHHRMHHVEPIQAEAVAVADQQGVRCRQLGLRIAPVVSQRPPILVKNAGGLQIGGGRQAVSSSLALILSPNSSAALLLLLMMSAWICASSTRCRASR